MTQPPAGTIGHPVNDHWLYQVYGTDGRVSTRCTSSEHEDGNWVGPHVSRDEVVNGVRLSEDEPYRTRPIARVLGLREGEEPTDAQIGEYLLDEALRLGREEHDRVTHHAILGVREPQHEASEGEAVD